MPTKFVCPYFEYEKDGALYCNLGKFVFPDKIARRHLAYSYCAGDYNNCQFNKILESYYERIIINEKKI